MLGTRLITAALGIPLFLAALVYGGLFWSLLMALLAVVGSLEAVRLFTPTAGRLATWLTPLGASLLILLAYTSGGDGGLNTPGLAGAALLLAVYLSWRSTRVRSAHLPEPNALTPLLPVFYPGLFLALLVVVRDVGLYATLFVVGVTWSTDTFAYATGMLIGQRPLWPRISPKKTLEGALGGVLGGVLFGWILGVYAGSVPVVWAGSALITAVAAQFGDLVESGLKRQAGVKDSGRLLPGHGGVLDRIDSLLFAGIIVYYLHMALR